jgi:uncharacterized protein YjbI with pentapeptide repeats
MADADLRDADLEGTNLRGTRMAGAKLGEAQRAAAAAAGADLAEGGGDGETASGDSSGVQKTCQYGKLGHGSTPLSRLPGALGGCH